jgi:hypothetical protein
MVAPTTTTARLVALSSMVAAIFLAPGCATEALDEPSAPESTTVPEGEADEGLDSQWGRRTAAQSAEFCRRACGTAGGGGSDHPGRNASCIARCCAQTNPRC